MLSAALLSMSSIVEICMCGSHYIIRFTVRVNVDSLCRLCSGETYTAGLWRNVGGLSSDHMLLVISDRSV